MSAKEQLYPLFRQTYAAREQEFGAERMREIERIILLRVVDEYWMDNIDAMEDLKQGIRLRAYGQTDPVVAYKREGFAMFDGMINAIREETVRRLYLFRLRTEEDIQPQAGRQDHGDRRRCRQDRQAAARARRSRSARTIRARAAAARNTSIAAATRTRPSHELPRPSRRRAGIPDERCAGRRGPLLFHPLRRGERGRARQPEPRHAPGRPAGKRAGELCRVSAGPSALRRRRPCSRSRCIPPSSSGSAARTAAAACSGRPSTACDGLVTNEPGVALTIFSADCTPVLLFDPVARAIGAAHAGWRGTAAGIAARAVGDHAAGVRLPTRRTSARPSVRASAPCCFETDADVPDAMRAALGSEAGQAIRPAGAKILCRPEAAAMPSGCAAPGVTCIDISADCTACQPQRFWSHRRVGNARGSLAAIIRLQGGAA